MFLGLWSSSSNFKTSRDLHVSTCLSVFISLTCSLTSSHLSSVTTSSSLTQTLLSPSYKDLCDYTGPTWASQAVLVVENASANAGDAGSTPGFGRSPGEGNGSNIFAWKIPWTEEPSGLQYMESQKKEHIHTQIIQDNLPISKF